MRFLSKPREIEIFGDVPFVPEGFGTPAKLRGGGQTCRGTERYADTGGEVHRGASV